MIEDIQLRVEPQAAVETMRLIPMVSTLLHIDANRIRHIKITRRSIDARQRRVMVNVGVRVWIDEEPADTSLAPAVSYPDVSGKPDVIIVGAGPAGLFAALRLIELGLRPVILERGKDVDERRKDMARIARENVVNPDSNYCFGEGGAGAFSDGKLYTRSKKRGSVDKILAVLHQHGASEEILIDAHPHIGTDRLPAVIKAMRETIVRAGGEVRFNTRVTGLALDRESDRVTGVMTAAGEKFDGPVILATGHSARDIYRMLHDSGIKLEPKGLAIGVRLEHPQQLIDRLRYHSPAGRGKYLPAAEYTMLTRVNDRAVYSFCMCPGGFIIPAASDDGQLVVNGMSPSNRGTKWANSGMVVEILPDDVPDPAIGDNALKMMDYQESIERRFWEDAGKTQNAPAQRMTDFVDSRPSRDLPSTSYAPGIHPARIDKLLPPEIAKRLQQGFRDLDKKNRGFLTREATLIGAETRTSSPVRIPRHDDTLQHVEIAGLFPCGEGAGYAGGIVSAAIDGERSADAVCEYLKTSDQ